MNPAHLPDQIEQWLHDKDAESLTRDEQELVIQALGSLDAYRRLRLVASRSQEALNAGRISPAGSTLGTILSRVAAQEQDHPHPRIRMAIPLYQAAASVVLAIALTWWWATSRPGAQPEPVVITLVDTVYQEVVRVDTVQVVAKEQTPGYGSVAGKIGRTTSPRSTPHQPVRRDEPDYRFPRMDVSFVIAHRQGRPGKPLIDKPITDSLSTMDQLFVTDRTLL